MIQHSVNVINDDEEEAREIKVKTDLDIFGQSSASNVPEDPFEQKWSEIRKSDGLSPNFRRQATRLEKAFTGDGMQSLRNLIHLTLQDIHFFRLFNPHTTYCI